jgi:hypothetical protein
MEAEMRQLGRRLDVLSARARVAEAGVREKSLVQLRRLKVKQAQAKVALGRLGRQSAAASGTVKAAFRRAWRDIDVAVKRAAQRLRKAG